MTHDELLAKINRPQAVAISVQGMGSIIEVQHLMAFRSALYAVVELHRPQEIKLLSGEVADTYCYECEGLISYPCPTIQAIEKELL